MRDGRRKEGQREIMKEEGKDEGRKEEGREGRRKKKAKKRCLTHHNNLKKRTKCSKSSQGQSSSICVA